MRYFFFGAKKRRWENRRFRLAATFPTMTKMRRSPPSADKRGQGDSGNLPFATVYVRSAVQQMPPPPSISRKARHFPYILYTFLKISFFCVRVGGDVSCSDARRRLMKGRLRRGAGGGGGGGAKGGGGGGDAFRLRYKIWHALTRFCLHAKRLL